uniref:Large ribosomal subunit protein eL33 n=1 Tax=Piliocolobus tephrosceles TaxID=591936 RepID=A0A8C9I8J1_9PRIM
MNTDKDIKETDVAVLESGNKVESKNGTKKALKKKVNKKKKLQAVRLFEKGVILGYKRSQRNQDPNFTLISIKNVKTRQHAQFYVGKKVAYVYRTVRHHNGTKIRCMWGKICRTHGNSGVVRAKFRNHIPPCAFGNRGIHIYKYILK